MNVQIRRILLPQWWDPETVFSTLHADDPFAFWLDAGLNAGSGFSYLGSAGTDSRFVTSSVTDGTVTVSRPHSADAGVCVSSPGTIMEFLRQDLAGVTVEDDRESSTGPFQLGWVGWLGYELGAQTIGSPARDSRYPDAALLEIDRAVAFNHAEQTVTLLARLPAGTPEGAFDGAAASDEIDHWAGDVLTRLRRAPTHLAEPGSAPRGATLSWRHDAGEYGALIERCQVAIRAGDAYQLCLTNEIRVEFAAGTQPEALDTYRRLRAGSPSHHGGCLRFGETALLSASPEQFLMVGRDGTITTKPIKGTRPRSPDPLRDQQLRVELISSVKERAENLMIVDLMRNDLGRVAQLGSVDVTTLLAVESYPHVHQLVSTIEARLSPALSAVDAAEACFPAGSMTGVPKRRATTLLHEIENGPRGIYSGAFGYFGLDGAADLAMVIRSIVLDSTGASVGTGGGITALSDAGEEIDETRLKAAALLRVLGSLN